MINRRLRSRRRGESTGLQTKVTTAPSINPITATEAKNWGRITTSAEDTIIDELIESATLMIEDYFSLSLITQTRKAFWETYADGVVIPNGPIQSITTVTEIQEGNRNVVSASNYHTSGLDYLTLWLDTYFRSGEGYSQYSLEVEYVSGFGDAASDVPEQIKKAIAIQVAHLYEYRQEFRENTMSLSMSGECKRLMARYSRRDWL